jgi:hypothetical protein
VTFIYAYEKPPGEVVADVGDVVTHPGLRGGASDADMASKKVTVQGSVGARVGWPGGVTPGLPQNGA